MAKAFARGRPIAPLVLSAPERAYLERQVRRRRVTRSLSERCRVILRCADGLPSKSVGAELGLHEHTVGKWRRRFLKDRCEGLLDEARPGRPRTIDDDQVAAVIERTLRTTPADATHWSIRSMAAETGFSHTTIRRMWAAFGLQPHRSQTFSHLEQVPGAGNRTGVAQKHYRQHQSTPWVICTRPSSPEIALLNSSTFHCQVWRGGHLQKGRRLQARCETAPQRPGAPGR